MKRIKHVTNTWLLALHLFPIVFLAWNFLCNGTMEPGLLLFLFFFAALFSLPALLLCGLLFYGITQLSLDVFSKMGLWLLAVPLAIVLYSGLVAYLFGVSFIDPDLLPFIGSATVAALLSILLRLKQFIYLVITQHKSYE